MRTQKNELYILIFLLGIVLFNWPLLKTTENAGVWAQFIYLFLIWSAIVFLSLVIGGFKQTSSIKDEKDSMVVSGKKEN